MLSEDDLAALEAAHLGERSELMPPSDWSTALRGEVDETHFRAKAPPPCERNEP